MKIPPLHYPALTSPARYKYEASFVRVELYFSGSDGRKAEHKTVEALTAELVDECYPHLTSISRIMGEDLFGKSLQEKMDDAEKAFQDGWRTLVQSELTAPSREALETALEVGGKKQDDLHRKSVVAGINQGLHAGRTNRKRAKVFSEETHIDGVYSELRLLM